MRARRIWVVGATGQLGRRVAARLTAAGHNVLTDRLNLDSQEQTIFRQVSRMDPEVLINCAAITNVDYCETPDGFRRALHCNSIAVSGMAMAMRARKNGLFVHVSSDMIFGASDIPAPPWTEEASPSPVNKYGLTKYAGEAAIARAFNVPVAPPGSALVIRVQHLWSSDRGLPRFILDGDRTRRREAVAVDDMTPAPFPLTVSDGWVKPTSARMVARDMVTLIEDGWAGTFHLGPEDVATPVGVVEHVTRELDLKVHMVAVPHDSFFEGRARRHARSQLKVQKVTLCRAIQQRSSLEHLEDIIAEIREDQRV